MQCSLYISNMANIKMKREKIKIVEPVNFKFIKKDDNLYIISQSWCQCRNNLIILLNL